MNREEAGKFFRGLRTGQRQAGGMQGMTDSLSIGERVAWYRRRRSMPQEVLAGEGSAPWDDRSGAALSSSGPTPVATFRYRPTRSYSKSSAREISPSTASVRFGLSMRTPNSMLLFSALQEKLALVTRRKRWSTARNFAWLRT